METKLPKSKGVVEAGAGWPPDDGPTGVFLGQTWPCTYYWTQHTQTHRHTLQRTCFEVEATSSPQA